MTVNANDLPPEVRKKLGLTGGTRKRKAPSRAGASPASPCPGTCGCGTRFDTYAKWERHADKAGCTRWDVDIPESTSR